MSKVNDPIGQQIHRENAERMCLANFISGLAGVVGREVRYDHPKNIREAVKFARAVDETEEEERRNETFYTRSDEFAGQLPRSPGKSKRGRNDSERTADSRTKTQQIQTPRSTRSQTQGSSSPRCYECEGIGHFAR